MTDRLTELKEMPERWVVGLNSGTSLDGVDAALVRVAGHGFDVRFSIAAFRTSPFSDRLAARLVGLERLGAREISDLNMELGLLFGRAALDVAREAGLAPGTVHLIGSHGLTIYHRPPRRRGDTGSTLQVGDLAAIAEVNSCCVIGDFRTADMAAGGQGAPLVPYLDYLLFREQPGTMLLNIGGIANLTYVGEELEDLVAFDVGPGNMPLNRVVHRLSRGEATYDLDGRTAAMGHVEAILLEKLLALPYLQAAPPKSTGREEFGEAWTDELLESHSHMKLVDILATLTAFVARSVRRAADDWVKPKPLRRVVVAGGGVHNLTLMAHLRRAFDPVPVQSFLDHVGDPDAKEALLFALLANDRLFGHPTNVPAATGAKWPVGLGKVVF